MTASTINEGWVQDDSVAKKNRIGFTFFIIMCSGDIAAFLVREQRLYRRYDIELFRTKSMVKRFSWVSYHDILLTDILHTGICFGP